MSGRGGTTLYVTGFSSGTRARDLAYEFERYGRLVRCDIPAPRTASSRFTSTARFAFVEYESRRDADDAYYEMHGRRIGRDDLLKIEWARTPPSASWRFDGGRDAPRGGARRGGSPRRGRSVSRGRDSPRRSERRGERDARSRSPGRKGDDDLRRPDDDRERSPLPANGDDSHHRKDSPLHDDLDTADLAD